jgi:hypothetical protein
LTSIFLGSLNVNIGTLSIKISAIISSCKLSSAKILHFILISSPRDFRGKISSKDFLRTIVPVL